MEKLPSFEEALEKYQNARKTMNLKQKLKKQLPPRGSAFIDIFLIQMQIHHHITNCVKKLII